MSDTDLTLSVSRFDQQHLIVADVGGSLWWTVTEPNRLGQRLIQPGNRDVSSRAVRRDGPLGRRILAAVTAFEAGER